MTPERLLHVLAQLGSAKAMVEEGRWHGVTSFRHWQTQAAIPVSDEHFVIRDPDSGRMLGMGTVTRDVSDIKRARDEVEAANRRLQQVNAELTRLYEKAKDLDQIKTQLFANVSHELRTPLTLILGPTQRLLDDASTPEPVRRDLEVVARNARTLLRHVNDLLDVTKLEASRMDVDYAEADIVRLARFVASHFEVLADEKHIRYALDIPDGLHVQPQQHGPPRVCDHTLRDRPQNCLGQAAAPVRADADHVCVKPLGRLRDRPRRIDGLEHVYGGMRCHALDLRRDERPHSLMQRLARANLGRLFAVLDRKDVG
jgi:signal transduction histidine kinase